MYTLQEQGAEYNKLSERSKALLSDILKGIEPLRAGVRIPADHVLFTDPQSSGRLYLLREGALKCVREGRVLFFFDTGDLVGLQDRFFAGAVSVRSEFAVVVDEYDYAALQKLIAANSKLQDNWNEYFAAQFILFTAMLGNLLKESGEAEPALRFFSPGDVIIEQGAEAPDVFNLVEGNADVYLDGVKVGEILRDEIFGALAALTGTRRTAQVVARTNCMALTLPKDNFVQLIQSRPNTVLKLVQDMARTIVSLNQQVVELAKKV